MSQVGLTIDGVQVTARSGTSLLEAARGADIYIPSLCSHPSLPPGRGKVPVSVVWRDGQIIQGDGVGPMEFTGCGLCQVEVDGELVRACSTPVREGLRVQSQGPEIKAGWQERLAEILADHPHACLICPNREGCDRIACSLNVPVDERCCTKFSNCELRRVADYVGIRPDTPRYVPRKLPVLRSDPLFTRDYNLCIGCIRCVRACGDLRGVEALGFTLCDGQVVVGTTAASLPESGCKFCAACVEVCPTGALMDKAANVAGAASREQSLVPCRAACPAGVDIPRYVRLVAQGRYDEAVSVIRERAPFPAVLGYVCFHPCESACRRGKVNEPIAICGLKRFAAERASPNGPAPAPPSSGKRIAVVGSGPTGLTAGYYLRGKGHGVTVFEAGTEPGGMLRHGIPRYRIPTEVVRREIAQILSTGIELRTETPVGPSSGLTVEKLRGEYDAVFLSVGAQMSKKIRLDGSDLQGVLWGLDFLREANLGSRPATPLGRVVVVGGGNVAMDVALTARRLGARDLQIACLESRAEMPAFEWEIEQTREEGALLHPSWGPKRIFAGGNGKVAGIELVRCTRVFDDSGRFNPSFDPSVTTTIDADTIILAIGQSVDFSFLGESGGELRTARGTIRVDETSLATPLPGIFAGGELVSGPASVIQAIAAGRKAAASMDRYLGGDGLFAESVGTESSPRIGREGNFALRPRVKMPRRSLGKRQVSFEPVETGFDNAMALDEAQRCLRCNLRLEIGAPFLPPESWLAFAAKAVAGVPAVEGVYQLLDENKQILRIAGAADLRRALEEQLGANSKARYFVYEEAGMYTQRESELLQRFLQEHGRLPPGNDLGDDLF